MAEFPSMPFYTDAYMADTSHLTTIEHGAYLLLLFAMWRTEGKELPNDDKKLSRYARLTAGQWKKIKPNIWEFFDVQEDAISQKKLRKIHKAVRQKSKSGRDNVNSRWLKNNNSEDTGVSNPYYETDTTKTKTKYNKENIKRNGENEEGDSPPENRTIQLLKQIKFMKHSEAEAVYQAWIDENPKEEVDAIIKEAVGRGHDLSTLKDSIASIGAKAVDPDTLLAAKMRVDLSMRPTRDKAAKRLYDKGLINRDVSMRNGYEPPAEAAE